MNSARSIGGIALKVLDTIERPAGVVDERLLFRRRLIRTFRFSSENGVPELPLGDLRAIVNRYATYPWHQAEFEQMVDDGSLVRSGGPHGDEELYRLGQAA